MRCIVMWCLLLTSLFLNAQTFPFEWQTNYYDFGTVQKGVPATFEFWFQNNTESPVKVTSVMTNCKCVKPHWDDLFIEPKAWGNVRLTFVEKNVGVYTKKVKVIIGSFVIPEILEIKATVGDAFVKKIEPESPKPYVELPKQELPADETVKSDVSILKNDRLNTAKYASYLTNREKLMIAEINSVRSNPLKYSTIVRDYIFQLEKEVKTANERKQAFLREEIKTAKDLMIELQRTSPMPLLKPHKKLFEAVKYHGDDMKKTGSFSHRGSNGQSPQERIAKLAPMMNAGAENLVGGHKEVRMTLLSLLVDTGIKNHLHRKNILNPNWEFVSVYEVGRIRDLNYVWVQNFSKSKETATQSASDKTSVNIPGRPTTSTNNKVETPIKQGQSADIDTGKDVPYLTARERAMIKEINYVRSQPLAYAKIVEEYIATMNKDITNNSSAKVFYLEELKAAQELVDELRVLNPLSVLHPREDIYKVAIAHGKDMQTNQGLNHVGSDGSYPWDRILRVSSDLKDGNENLVGGPDEVRQSVLLLLIDSGIPNRGHRRTLLQADWKYVICYEVGSIGKMPNCWVQNFAK